MPHNHSKIHIESQGSPSSQNDHKREEAKMKNSHIMILKHTSKVQSGIRVVKGAKPDKTDVGVISF